jgi:diguanylate cyclase (GGDEF)-like protein
MNLKLLNNKAPPFQMLLASIAALAAFLHVIFLLFFIWVGAKTLAMVNIASVSLHALAFLMIVKDHQLKGLFIILMEVIIHSIVASYEIGWASGFFYYFIIVVQIIALSTLKDIKTKIFFISITIVAYLIFDYVLRKINPSQVLPEETLEILYYFNAASIMITSSFVSFCYYYLISQAEIALVEAANTDPLTKLSNRRCFMQSIDKEMARTDREHLDLSFIICDLDYFKAINDQHGHDAGDMVLKAVGNLLNNEIRHCDKLSRWGGEEFLIMLPDATRTEAVMTAERLRKKVENLHLSYSGENLSISMTLGVTSLTNLEKPEHAIARADTGLYKGKNSGRNCVVLV